jgi:hypothetical protein
MVRPYGTVDENSAVPPFFPHTFDFDFLLPLSALDACLHLTKSS